MANKFVATILVFLVSLLTFAGSVTATSWPEPLDISFDKVEINDAEVTSDTTFDVERGEPVEVRVTFTSNNNTNDVRLKAWIEGYEYDDIEDKTDLFDVKEGITYTKKLELVIPEDSGAVDIVLELKFQIMRVILNTQLMTLILE